MNNDRVFSIYAATLIAGAASLVTASVMAGYAAVPGLIGFLSHWALSLGFRAAYKSFDPNFNVIPFVNRSLAVEPAGVVHGEVVEEEKLAA
ncbi:MAG: hypothetical protein GY937_19735 [bacterium]|nr:hypothetical protein [bacterium]